MHPDEVLEACLPAELRSPGMTFQPVAAGLSGAGVYRVETAGRAYVLKVAPAHEPLEGWRVRAEILRAAADAGVPRVAHRQWTLSMPMSVRFAVVKKPKLLERSQRLSARARPRPSGATTSRREK